MLHPQSRSAAEPNQAPSRLADESDEAYRQAMGRAIRWLTARSRSSQEVCDRLRAVGFSEEIVNRVGARLVELSILDDQEFAREWIERGLVRGQARRLLDCDLAAKRIARETIDTAMDEFADSATELERATDLARKHVRAFDTLCPERAWRRLANYLARKGYEQEVVGEVCRTVLADRLGDRALIDGEGHRENRHRAASSNRPGSGTDTVVSCPQGTER